eukprot:131173-Prymnesium_polylepis.2
MLCEPCEGSDCAGLLRPSELRTRIADDFAGCGRIHLVLQDHKWQVPVALAVETERLVGVCHIGGVSRADHDEVRLEGAAILEAHRASHPVSYTHLRAHETLMNL